MTNLLEVTAARMVVRDTDGTNVFDTDERPFLPLATINGTAVLPGYEASSNSTGLLTLTDVSNTYTLGSCPSVCNVIRGAFFVSAAQPAGVANVGYFNAGGTYLHWLAEGATAVAYTFYASGGGVYLNERAVVIAQVPASGSRVITLYQPTFTYRLIAGVFL